jgi:hypothetical protein
MSAATIALLELVACKDLLERIEAYEHTECLGGDYLNCPEVLMRDEYEKRMPAAWKLARETLRREGIAI